ncbi:MAG: hypothetical protein LBJ87_04880 [bacterium]|jgi:hypothetical protein|nr:hypothetical protein [bacterium]
MPEVVGLGGRWALVAAAVVVLVPAVALVPRGRRVRRRARIVDARLTELRQTLDERLDTGTARRAELRRLLRPWRRALFWARHPLTVALFRSYRRRLAALR